MQRQEKEAGQDVKNDTRDIPVQQVRFDNEGNKILPPADKTEKVFEELSLKR